MQTFDEKQGCPKCGSGFVTMKHGSRYPVMPDDLLHRECERCGYRWAEKPLDAEA